MRTVDAAGEALMTAPAPFDPRYAVFLCPDPRGAAGLAAAQWLGRCAARDALVVQPFVPGMSSSLLCALTEEPRRYGFHATLRAPFRAGHGVTRKALAKAIASVASAHVAFRLPPLRVRVFRDVLALVPEGDAGPAARLAAECVMRMDRLRAPITGEEIRARVAAGLTARQRGLLLRWGHPYVMDEFRLHYPLSGQLTPYEEAVAERLAVHAGEHFRGVLDELRAIDRIALFEQAAPGAAFRLVDMAPLAGPAGRSARPS